jgi:hypothetical protein
MRTAAPLLFFLLLCGCPGGGDLAPEPLDPLPGRDDLDGTLMQVADFQQPCREAAGAVVLCLRVRFEGEDDWTDLPGPIVDFAPKWGTRYLLDVEVLTEAGETTYTKLASLDAEEFAPGGVFELTLRSDFLVGGARLVGGRDFDCETHELCGDLDERLDAGGLFPAWFQHPEDEDDPLILVAVLEV